VIAEGTGSFQFDAASEDGRRHHGSIAAPSRERALHLLAARGLFVTELRATAPARAAGRRIGTEDLALTLRVLAELLDSGMPLPRALQALEPLAAPRFAAALPAVRVSVREGMTLTAAIATADVRMPAVVTGVIRAGERGGGLADAVRQAAEIAESSAATAASVRTALAYPALLAVFGSAAIALLVGVVLPRFASVLADMGSTLPPTTRLVLKISARLKAMAPLGALGIALALVSLGSWIATPAGRRQWHGLLLGMPWLGETRLVAGSSRMAQALAALLANGVTIAAGLGRAAEATGDATIEARAEGARAMLEQGVRLSDALAAHHVVTGVTAQLIRAGEESGRLPQMLRHAATLERARAARRIQGIVRVLEPALIVAFGGVVAFVALALLQALYSARPGA